jgi:iron complex outermembrane receptor protein
VFYADRQGGYIDNVLGTYQMPFDGHVGQAGQLPTGNPLLVERALQSCIGVSNCTGSGYTPPIRQTINNAAYVKNNYNSAVYKGFRAALSYKLNADWSIDAMHTRQKLSSEGVFDYQPSVGDLKVTKFAPNTLDDTFDMTTLNVTGRIGALSVLYSGSYVHHQALQTADYASYSNVGLYLPYYECDKGVYYNGTPNAGNTCYSPSKTYQIKTVNKRLTNEVRIVTPADKRLRGTVGLFYDVNKLWDNTDWLYSQSAAGFIYPRSINPSLSANDYGVKPVQDTFFNDTYRLDKQFAAYGEASFDIVPQKLILTGGARYYSETASMTGSSSGSFDGLSRGVYNAATGTYSASTTAPQYYGISADLSKTLAGLSPAHYHGVIPKANLTYKFDGGSLVYATYSEGFRPGGFNRRPCRSTTPECISLRYYRPDNVKNYELGWKLSLLNHKLQLNAAAYIVQWTNIQMSVFDQNISNQTFTNNLLDARIHGLEGDVAWRATRELTVNSSFSFNDSKVTRHVKDISALVPVGSPLATSPKFQFSITGRYEKPLASGYKPFVQASFHHVSSSISSDVANTSIRWTGAPVTYNGKLVNTGDVISPQISSLSQAGYQTVDGSFGVSKDNWTLEVFGKNLTDARPELFKSTSDGEMRVTTSRPLTVGLRASITY